MSLFKNSHANQRYFERVHPDTASKKDIIKAFQNPNNIQYIKKLTESRSMAYIHLPNDTLVKVIINKNKKEIVTILPWQDVYQIEIEVTEDNDKTYLVELYPDCLCETKNTTIFNKVCSIDENEKIKNIPFSDPIFKTIVNKAYQIHCGKNHETFTFK